MALQTYWCEAPKKKFMCLGQIVLELFLVTTLKKMSERQTKAGNQEHFLMLTNVF